MWLEPQSHIGKYASASAFINFLFLRVHFLENKIYPILGFRSKNKLDSTFYSGTYLCCSKKKVCEKTIRNVQAGTNAPDHQTMSGKKIEMSGKNFGVPDHLVWCSDKTHCKLLSNFTNFSLVFIQASNC
jgi:hypothetical protein